MDSGDASRSPNPNRRDSICLPGISHRTSNLTKGQTSHDGFLHVAALNEIKREKRKVMRDIKNARYTFHFGSFWFLSVLSKNIFTYFC